MKVNMKKSKQINKSFYSFLKEKYNRGTKIGICKIISRPTYIQKEVLLAKYKISQPPMTRALKRVWRKLKITKKQTTYPQAL